MTPSPSRAAAPAPSTLRPFTAADAGAVAALFIETMQDGAGRAPGPLTDYFRAHFLEGPFADPDIPSQVAETQGEIIGFVGATTHRVELAGAEKTIAIGSTLMVRQHSRDPMTGARLMRALLSGPQDATLSETAGEESVPMWKRLGSEALPLSSLDWVRVLRPAGFALAALSRRLAPLGWLAPLARPLDGWAAGRKPDPTWTSLPKNFRPRGGVQCLPLDRAGFTAIAAESFAASPVRPLYGAGDLERVIGDALQKSTLGPPHLRAIATPDGKRLGAALYHMPKGGIARLHTLLAPPAHREAALDAVLADIRAAGGVAAMGRAGTDLFEMLSRRRAVFLRTSATVIHTQDEPLRAAFQRGDFPLNGLFGERWSRLIGDDALWR